MTQIDVPHLDARVAAILNDPDTYFATAARRAWRIAAAEVTADLRVRAEHRRDHRSLPHPPLSLLGLTPPT